MGKFLAGNKAGKRFTMEYNILKSVINDYKSGKVGWGCTAAQVPVRDVDKGKKCRCVQGAIADKIRAAYWYDSNVQAFCLRAGLTVVEPGNLGKRAWSRNDTIARKTGLSEPERFAEFIAWLESCLPKLMRDA